MTIKSLAMLKMEKNFIAVIEKGYPRRPYEYYDLEFLRKRLLEEILELSQALRQKDFKNAKCECADVSNIVDYIFEKLADRT